MTNSAMAEPKIVLWITFFMTSNYTSIRCIALAGFPLAHARGSVTHLLVMMFLVVPPEPVLGEVVAGYAQHGVNVVGIVRELRVGRNDRVVLDRSKVDV